MNIKTSFLVQLFPRNGEDSPNGYYICIYRNLDTRKKITCKGYNLPRKKLLQYKYIDGILINVAAAVNKLKRMTKRK